MKPIIVCSRNAILFGWTADPTAIPLRLEKARWAYYWVNPGGHLGLAETGPQVGSRIGSAGTITLTEVACVIDATAGADVWEAYPVSTS